MFKWLKKILPEPQLDGLELCHQIRMFMMQSEMVIKKYKTEILTKEEARQWLFSRKELIKTAAHYWTFDEVSKFLNESIITKEEFKDFYKR